jgi:hypothetical protein
VIVRSKAGERGTITLKARAEGLEGNGVTLRSE